MAIVFLALNGDGLGHLVRITTVCHSLVEVGERPVIFSQGIYPLDDRANFPGKRIPSLWKSNYAVRRAVSAELRAMAEITLPSVLVEDTHPNPIWLPPNIRRVLLVRPAAFEHLTMLNEEFGTIYSLFVLCDFPESPTWPYSPEETARILKWPSWHIVGPIYRTASQADIAEVQRRYRIDDEERVCIFTMGGGGRHVPGDTDAERFMHLSVGIAERLRNRRHSSRLIFVKGPYFPPEVKIDPMFEVVAQEPLMPALLASAHGVVVRAGFNTPWECISAGTPFLPFIGTTVNEPVAARLRGMRALGLLADHIDQLWYDDAWRETFRQSCRRIVSTCSGKPNARLLQKLIVQSAEGASVIAVSSGRSEQPVPVSETVPRGVLDSRFAMPFVIRIDDVASSEPALEWLLQQLSIRGLRASLGVIPYFLDFDASFLDSFDPAGMLFKVSQQGYAQVARPRSGYAGREFLLDSTRPFRDEVTEIDWGRNHLQQAFSARWDGGFSAPFDAMPSELQTWWRDCGGTFVTGITEKRGAEAPLPVVHASALVWDSDNNWMHSRRWISRRLAQQAIRHGYAGIAIRLRCLRHPILQARLIEVLDFLENRGIATASLSEIASRWVLAKPTGAKFQNYIWSLITWALARQ
jgi:hypothetical protein